MHKCLHQNTKKDFCYTCVTDLHATQGKIIDQLDNRLNYLWEQSDAPTKKLMVKAEQKFPLASTQILASFPIKNEDNLDQYFSVFKDAVKALKSFSKDYPNARIKFYDHSFVVYSNL